MNEDHADIAHDVGMVNPFALFDAINGSKTSWGEMLENGKGRSELKKMFESTFDFEYSKLWDPKNGSPLYTWTQRSPKKNMVLKMVK